jgi:predicted CoA-binding protein
MLPPMPDASSTPRARIRALRAGRAFAGAGASTDRTKYGNRVLRHYLAHGRRVWAVHRHEAAVEGAPAVRSVADLPEPIDGLSVVTPPAITEQIVEQAAAAGIPRVWMQPGAESAGAVARAEELGLEPIWGGPCVLIEL